MFPYINGEVLNDELVIIHSSGSAGEPEIFEPNTRVCLPGVLGGVGGQSKTPWEWRPSNAPAKGPWSRALWAGTPVVQPVVVPRAHFTAPLNGPARACVACPCRCPMSVITVPGLMPVVDGATGVLVWTELPTWRRSV